MLLPLKRPCSHIGKVSSFKLDLIYEGPDSRLRYPKTKEILPLASLVRKKRNNKQKTGEARKVK